MPRPKKKARDLTDEEAIKKLFPKKARDEAKKEAENPMAPTKTRNIDTSKH